MKPDPTAELLQAMAECGLHPLQIIWDGQWHRFPGIDQTKGDNGRYKAFADQRGAIFMDMRTKEQWRWPGDNPMWREKMKHFEPLSAAEVAKRKKAAAEQRAKDAEIHTKRILNLWERAKPLEDRGHPYLEGKGITGNIPILKSIIDPDTEQEMLLIPMRDRHGSIRNLQRIWPDGTRKQMKQATGSSGLYETIGAARYYINTKTLYICEGWATGWSISQASGCAVIVAFFDGGLLTVGQIIRKKYPDAKLIIAADNDRWKPVKREGRMVNPGVWAARRAAKKLNAAYVVPDFPDLSTEPTDYDDLRRLTNLAVVREWLDPTRASEAVITPPPEPPEPEEPEEPEPEEPEEEEEEEHWTESFPSRFLGGIGHKYYFVPEDYGQILALSAGQMRVDTNLSMLAPSEWYRDHFGRRTRNGTVVEWSKAAHAIIRESMRTGTYQPRKVRGRGVWEDKDHKPLFHLGDRLLPPDGKRYILPKTYDGADRIYPRLTRLEGPATELLPVRTARWLLNLFEALLWEHPASGPLVAGWTALAPFCGWLGWRPHIWITGPAGCGKSTIIRDIIKPLLAGMVSYNKGGTTEAGIRQTLGSDALPVLIDDMGQNTPRQVQGILRLMRSASSSGDGFAIVKGTRHGKALEYHARAMFCLGSVGGALKDPQDQQRVLLAHLRDPRTLGAGRQSHWHKLQARINRISPRLGHMLLARSVKWARSGRLTELLAITRTAASIVLDSERAGDQFGTLLAGTFMLKERMENKLPDQDEVVAYAKKIDLTYHMEDKPEGRDILDLLLRVREAVPTPNGRFNVTVREMISLVINGPPEPDPPTKVIPCAHAKRYLRNIGFLVDGEYLFVANQSSWISDQLRETSHPTEGYYRALRSLPGATAGGGAKWSAGRRTRTTKISLRLI